MKTIKLVKNCFPLREIYSLIPLLLFNLISTAQTSNLSYGTGALRLDQNNNMMNPGDFNTAIGINTLYNNTSGGWNTATGMNALFNNINGNFNTANGMSALFKNTSGSYNTAIGMNALVANTTGDSSIAIGVNALFTNTTGYNNIANGVLSLYLNKDGHDNIAMGYLSLYSNASGFNNVAIGSGALQNNTVSGNIAIGYQSLFSNVGGKNNIAIGNNALWNNKADNNTAIGYQSLLNNINANDNTAIGYQSLYTTQSPIAKYNVAVGSQALYTNNAGYSNTAIGYQALFNNGENGNTAIGAQSLYKNTSGKENVSVGASALYNNNKASYNTAIGSAALYTNSTGEYNTAVGYKALEKNNTNSNTAVGYAALQKCIADYNTAFGANALLNSTNGIENAAFGEVALSTQTANGSFNTALGNHSMRYHFSGNENVAVGFESLDSNITGSSNTAIGYMAGRENISGNRNVFIGYQAGFLEKGNDKLYIANNSDTPLIYGDFVSKNVGIKTTKAYSNLSITPNIDGSKITLWDNGDPNNHNGFGTSTNQLNYHVANQTNDHVFYAGGRSGNNGNNKELLRIKGNGNIGIGTPIPQAIVDISSTSSGILLPRMTQVQRDAISPKSAGMIVYNTNTEKLNYYDGTAAMWKELGTSNATAPAGSNGQIQFNDNGAFGAKSNLFWDNTNNMLGIGTPNPTASLTVKGNTLIGDPGVIRILPPGYNLYVQTGILTEKVTIAASNSPKWADYVFKKNYQLKPISELEEYVTTNNHLPNIPSAEEIAKNGIDVGNMNAKLLEKIEELHLYIFQLEKRVKEIELKSKSPL